MKGFCLSLEHKGVLLNTKGEHDTRESRQNSPKEKKHQIVRMALFMDVLLNTKDVHLHVLVHRIHRKVLAKYDGQCFLRQRQVLQTPPYHPNDPNCRPPKYVGAGKGAAWVSVSVSDGCFYGCASQYELIYSE